MSFTKEKKKIMKNGHPQWMNNSCSVFERLFSCYILETNRLKLKEDQKNKKRSGSSKKY
jgi:hypothetical protein